MAVEIRSISRAEAEAFVKAVGPLTKDVLAMTSLFYGGFAGGTLGAVIGIVVETLLDDEAYIWMQEDRSIAEEFPIAFAKLARRFITELPYTMLRGHTTEPFVPFIRWLGGDFLEEIANTLIPFEIRKQHG